MAYNSAYTGPQVDAAVGAVQGKETTWDGKQDKLTGQSGQVVGFDAEGNAIAQTPPETGDVKADGSVPMTGDLNMGGHKITNLGAPTNPNDAVRQADLKVVSDEVDGIISGTTGITLAPATTTKIGGVIVGDGIEVEADGTISTNPVPAGGTEGQVIKKTADGAEWDDAEWLPLSGGIMDNAVRIRWGTSNGASISSGVTTPELRFSSKSINNVSTNLYIGWPSGAGNAGNNVACLNYSNRELRLHLGGGEEDTVGRLTGLKTPVASNEATPKSYVDSKSPTSVTVTLTSSGWSSNTQTVTVSGVVASETAQLITPTPAIASQTAYYEAGIMCTNQGTNSLTFTCQTVPTSNLTVYVVIQPLS